MNNSITKRLIKLIARSPEKLKKRIRNDVPFEFSARPQWRSNRTQLDVIYSVQSKSGLPIAAIAAGIYFQDGTRVTTAANRLPNESKITSVDNWIINRSFKKPTPKTVQITVGLIAGTGINDQFFPYLMEFVC